MTEDKIDLPRKVENICEYVCGAVLGQLKSFFKWYRVLSIDLGE